MEGYIDVASPNEKKGQWQKMYVKVDDIAGLLKCYKNNTQGDLVWTMILKDAEIFTPIPGDFNHGVNTDHTSFCFGVYEGYQNSKDIHYFSALDEKSKKLWVTKILQVAQDGPREVKFSKEESGDDYTFSARVCEYRVHEAGYAVRI